MTVPAKVSMRLNVGRALVGQLLEHLALAVNNIETVEICLILKTIKFALPSKKKPKLRLVPTTLTLLARDELHEYFHGRRIDR